MNRSRGGSSCNKRSRSMYQQSADAEAVSEAGAGAEAVNKSRTSSKQEHKQQ